MSLVRCPSCGRAWDGELCFACGHQAKATGAPGVASSAASPPPSALPRSPSATFVPPGAGPLPQPSAQSPFGRPPASGAPPPVAGQPQFAPLPPLPPLPRAPTGSLAGVGAPPAVVGQPASQAGALRFPASTGAVSPILTGTLPAAPPGPIPPSFGATPAPITAVHHAPSFAPTSPPANAPPQAFAHGAPLGGPGYTPSLTSPATTAPYPAPAAPTPTFSPARTAPMAEPSPRPAPIASFQAARPHVLGDARPSVSSSAAAMSGAPMAAASPDDATQDVQRVAHRLPAPVRRIVHGAAAFPVVFFVGFLVAFVPAALILWRAPDAAELFAAGQYDAVVALVEARAASDTPATADELVLAGHSLAALGQRDRMVKTYAAARLLKKDIRDDRVVENLMKALPDERAGAAAAALLAEEWKGKNVLAVLQLELQNEDRVVRHHALRAVEPRLGEPNERARARLTVARMDLKDPDDCEAVKAAMLTIEDLAAKFPAVVRGLDLDSEVDAAGQRQVAKGKNAMCFTLKEVDRITRSLAVAESAK